MLLRPNCPYSDYESTALTAELTAPFIANE